MIGFGFVLIFGSLWNDFLCWWWIQGFEGLVFVVGEAVGGGDGSGEPSTARVVRLSLQWCFCKVRCFIVVV